MKIIKLTIGLHRLNQNNQAQLSVIAKGFNRHSTCYQSEAIQDDGKYFYRVDGTTVEALDYEYERVIANPALYYFSSALKLHFRVAKAKELNLGLDWPNNFAAPANIFELDK